MKRTIDTDSDDNDCEMVPVQTGLEIQAMAYPPCKRICINSAPMERTIERNETGFAGMAYPPATGFAGMDLPLSVIGLENQDFINKFARRGMGHDFAVATSLKILIDYLELRKVKHKASPVKHKASPTTKHGSLEELYWTTSSGIQKIQIPLWLAQSQEESRFEIVD